MTLQSIRSHIERFWPENPVEYFSWELGPIQSVAPEFRAARIAPISRDQSWIYVSVGSSKRVLEQYAIEFVLMTPFEDPLFVEILAMVTHYHLTSEKGLDLGGVVNLGRPWTENSSCDHFLVSLPFPFGPRLEWLHNDELATKHVRVLWLLPITAAEASFAYSKGVKALEDLLEEHEIDSLDPGRACVV